MQFLHQVCYERKMSEKQRDKSYEYTLMRKERSHQRE